MQMDGIAFVEGTDIEFRRADRGARRDSAGPVAEDSIESHKDLTLAAVVVGVATRVRISLETGIRGNGPYLDIDSAGVTVNTVLELNCLRGYVGRCRLIGRSGHPAEQDCSSEERSEKGQSCHRIPHPCGAAFRRGSCRRTFQRLP